ncbi:hypothetical protein CWC11_17535 [Pseudoalteromonas sp. S3178]|nr:hypothetical protein CWC11_17535 [Pseudoalteromonas sp. S3178]
MLAHWFKNVSFAFHASKLHAYGGQVWRWAAGDELRATSKGQRAAGNERLGIKITCRRLACWRVGIKMEASLLARASFTPTGDRFGDGQRATSYGQWAMSYGQWAMSNGQRAAWC